MAKDFRYALDGQEVEAFQLHEGSRYQEGDWPEWMNSRMLMTKENEDGVKTHWLNINDVETEISAFGWIVKYPDGSISTVSYDVMETAAKVVREPPRVPDVAKPQADAALRLAAKITKRPFDDVMADDLAQVEEANRNRQTIIDSMHPDDAEAGGFKQTGSPEIAMVETFPTSEIPTKIEEKPEVGPVADDPGHLETLKQALTLIQEGEVSGCHGLLKQYLSNHTSWCSCPPGHCDGERDVWECRQNSPLVQ